MEKIDLFIDSGAFSAHTQGVFIDIDEYIQFIKDNINIINVYANLDVIGDAEKSLENQRYMESKGLRPMPVFHIGEPKDYLEYYIANYDYIGLGGIASMKTNRNILVDYLDDCFANYICDDKGIPKVKVHGFGVTALRLLLRYPWYSVDSTAWIIIGRNGSILVPKFKDGKYQYLLYPFKVVVSHRSPSMKQEGQHFFTLTPEEQEVILNYLREKNYNMGKSEFKKEPRKYKLKDNERWASPVNKDGTRTVEIILERGLCNDYLLRDELNLIYFLGLEKNLPEWPWPFKQKAKHLKRGFGL